MSRSEHAVEQFQTGLNCAQAVFASFVGNQSLSEETAALVAMGFGGGLGRMGLVCGAVNGAVLAIGLLSNESDLRDPLAKARVYQKVQQFCEEFTERHGTLVCRELLGCDISTPDGYKQAQSEGLIASRCPLYVRDAVEIVEEITS
jgi:C_GCAxxG_C_C family probable redox protein